MIWSTCACNGAAKGNILVTGEKYEMMAISRTAANSGIFVALIFADLGNNV